MNRPEKLGLLLHEIEEQCLVLDGKNFVFVDSDIDINNLKILGCKDDWDKGVHGGDCTNAPATCCACFWSSIVDTGSSLALALTRGSTVSLDDVIGRGAEYGEEGVQVANKFKTEVVRLGL